MTRDGTLYAHRRLHIYSYICRARMYYSYTYYYENWCLNILLRSNANLRRKNSVRMFFVSSRKMFALRSHLEKILSAVHQAFERRKKNSLCEFYLHIYQQTTKSNSLCSTRSKCLAIHSCEKQGEKRNETRGSNSYNKLPHDINGITSLMKVREFS